MTNPKFETLVESLRREQERFRQERESRHCEFVRRMDTIRVRHENLVDCRIRRLSLDGIMVDIDGIKQRVRENSIISRENTMLARDAVRSPCKTPSNNDTKTSNEDQFKLKKILTFDSRSPRDLSPSYRETAWDTHKRKATSPGHLERGKMQLAQQNFKRIGRKVSTVVKMSAKRRHSVAAANHPVVVHVSALEDKFDNMQLYKSNTQISFEESAKRDFLSPNIARYPKLAIGRVPSAQRTPPKSPKQRLRSAVTKLEMARRFSNSTSPTHSHP